MEGNRSRKRQSSNTRKEEGPEKRPFPIINVLIFLSPFPPPFLISPSPFLSSSHRVQHRSGLSVFVNFDVLNRAEKLFYTVP